MGLEQVVIVMLMYTLTKSKVIESNTVSYKKSYIFLIFFIYSSILYNSYIDSKLPNAYEILEISRSLTSEEIKENYKAAMKYKHPDKNPSPYAQEEFISLKKNYDLIRTPDSRLKYEKYQGLDQSTHLWNTFQFYIGWIILCNFLYFSKIPNSGRNLLSVLTCYGTLEVLLNYSSGLFRETYYVNLTLYEQFQIVKVIFPAFNFFISCHEALISFETEQDKANKTLAFMRDGGKDLYEKIRNSKNSEILQGFVKETREAAVKKHSNSGILNVICLLVMIYAAKGKIFTTS